MSAQPAPAANDVGSELVLATAHDREQLVLARGSLFLVTERHGDVAPRGARELGLFDQDTRYLSHWELRILNRELVHLSAETSSDAFNQVDLMVSGVENEEHLDDPQNYLHVSRRQLLDGSLVEQLTITNFLSHATTLQLELAFDADFADIFEVRGAKRPRRGTQGPVALEADRVRLTYHALDGVLHTTELRFDPPPATLDANSARFQLHLEASGTLRVELRVTPLRSGQARAEVARSFSQRSDQLLAEARRFRDESTRVRCDNSVVQRLFEQSAYDLWSLGISMNDSRIIAAGIPWYCCPFGRDSLLASYEALLLNPDLARGCLRVLAAFQGTRDNDETEEEPGKIFHELRMGEMARTREIPHSPYYGSIDATPLFVILADAAHQVGDDLELLRELEPNLRAALAWIDRRTDEGRRFLTYERKSARGLDNQGWKDSRSGVPFRSGRRALPPIALCEVQGYCADAYARGARMLLVLGDAALAATYTARAAAFTQRIEEELWLPELGRYAFAIDGSGAKLDTVVSNLGHLLWSRVPSEERALSIAELLLSPASFSGFGIRTLASEQPAYNPLSYHNGTVWPHDNALISKGMANYGHTGYAATVFEGLIAAMPFFRDRRLPELFCGLSRDSGSLVRYPVACSPQAWASAAPFLLVQSVLGLELNAGASLLAIRNANLPRSIEWLELEGMRLGKTRISLRLRRAGKRVHVEHLDMSGPPIRTEIKLD